MTFNIVRPRTLLIAACSALLPALVAAQDLDAGAPLSAPSDSGNSSALELGPALLDAAMERSAPAARSEDAPAAVEAPTPLERAVAPIAVAPADVEVRARSRADGMRRSALAVGVIDLDRAKRATADMGEVLARHEGVAVRRSGGLGSDQRISLAGLEGEQIRLFLDGAPLELMGYPFGLANVPVNTLWRVEIYRGVVPIELGADALGGAVNLVSKAPRPGVHGSGSYQGGSFDTHRGTLDVSYLRRGWFARASGFADVSENDYPIIVDAETETGMPYRIRVRRFHDAYRAEGGNLALGVVDRSWAKKLVLRGFITDYHKELQHDVTMDNPYGEATSGGFSSGATLSYLHTLFDALELEGTAGYSFSATRLRDMTDCIYDWFGRCQPSVGLVNEIVGRTMSLPRDVRMTQQAFFARANARYALAEGHTLKLALAPTHVRRGGDDRYEAIPGARDPLDVDRRWSNFVLGLEYLLLAWDERLELSAFGKAYLQWVRSEELLRNGEDSVRRDRDTQRFGGGLTARFEFLESLWAKGSYEYATRLPSIDEVFGNGVLVDANLDLAPEVSHNANLSLATDHTSARAGRFAAEAGAFLREADRLIYLVGKNVYQYQNLASARSLGGMATASFSAPEEYVELLGNVTYQAFRSTATEGPNGVTDGQRIPNRPYFFANGSARAQLKSLFSAADALSLTYHVRYTHSFFRGWEELGRLDSKAKIPSQLVHSLLLTHLVQTGRERSFSMSFEIQNLTDERVYDFFGVQKPGRAMFAKAVAEL